MRVSSKLPRAVFLIVALLSLPACMASRSGGFSLQQLATLRVREIVVEAALQSPEQEPAFAELKPLLESKLVAELGPRYDPRAKTGYRLVVRIENAMLPRKDRARFGSEIGTLSGNAGLLDPSGTPLTTYAVTSSRAGRGTGQYTVLGLIIGAVAENAFPTDFAGTVADSAARQLATAILSPA